MRSANSVYARLLFLVCTTVSIVAVPTTSVFAAGDRSDVTPKTAERLLEEAVEAAKFGAAAQQFALLRAASLVSPDYDLPRWQLGQIEVDGEWLAVEEAQRRADANPKQAIYRQMRAARTGRPADELELARWCRKNGLRDEAQFHWMSLLSVRPNHEEALRAIGKRWHNGQLATTEDIASERRRQRELKRAVRRWSSTITKWQRAIAGADASAREAAIEEISSLSDVDAIPAMEKLTLQQVAGKISPEECQISIAFVKALTNMPAHAATESLVRHAVFCAVPEARTAAIEGLKARPQHEYVPLLLGSLSMPLESSFSVTTDSDGSVHYRHSLYREGPEADWSTDIRRSAMQHDLGGRRYTWDVATRTMEVGPPVESPVVVAAKKAAIASAYESRFSTTAALTEWQVAQLNQAAEVLNAFIIEVLTATTGKDLKSPKDWWDWWTEHNEYYVSDDHPVDRHYDSDTESYYHGGYNTYDVRYPPPPPPPPGRRYSCFAKGTLVWTKTGQRPIESLELGNLVLAQDVETGKLAYKPVIGRTVRPPSEILKVRIGDEDISTTRGHPFWVAGVGWRMAKELGDGAVLYGVTGAARIEAVDSAGEAEAYNLVVADFNTYFVGESGILVHDNTPRRPTRATVPGIVSE